MSEITLLFVVLAIIYLAECLLWVRRGTAAFASTLSGGFRIHDGERLLGNQRGGILLANPVPLPMGVVICQPWPVSLSPEGVYAYIAQALHPAGRPPQPERFLRYDEIESAGSASGEILINREVFARTGSPSLATHLSELLGRLARAAAPERDGLIAAGLRAGFDRRQIEERVAVFGRRTARLRWLCDGLLVYLFLLCPLAVARFGFESSWPILLGVMLLLQGASIVEYLRCHRALYPGESADRWLHAVTMLLAPPTAARSLAALARDLLATAHPLAVAHVLCEESAFLPFARRVLADARYPLPPACPTDEPAPRHTEEWFRSLLLAEMERFIDSTGFPPGELLAPPPPEDPRCRSYCPRCRCQYVISGGECASCGGLPLLALSGGRASR